MPNEPGQIPMDEPLAYFLAWTTYGTWLPGDNRGWVAKPGQFREPDGELRTDARRYMTEPALTLDAERRRIVENTIADHCRIRGWHLHAVSARTQHVHVVVSAPGRQPEQVMDQLKAWCSRRHKEHEQSRPSAAKHVRQNWWTQRGSKRWLFDSDSVEAAVLYVREGQGNPTPSDEQTQA